MAEALRIDQANTEILSEAQNDNRKLAGFSCWLAGSGEREFYGFCDAVLDVGQTDAPSVRKGERLEVVGGVIHEDCGAGDLEHGDVVPVVADGEDLRGVDASHSGE